MNHQKPVLFLVVLLLIGATAGVLAHAKSNQKLGLPGVKTQPQIGGQNLDVLLPENLPGYQSRALPLTASVTNALPKDTSFGQRLYVANDGFASQATVVLMGSSRESIHDPHVCLTAQGWNIDNAASRVEQVQLDRPAPYDLPMMRLDATREVEINGQRAVEQGIYLYWFVDADRYTASKPLRMLWMAQDVITKGELDRWAYVSFFSVCAPGQQAAAFDRMKKLITLATPEFQLVPRPAK